MKPIDERLNQIEEKIKDKSFRQNKGLGNEIGYYIFDYDPKDELYVREHVAYLKDKINQPGVGFEIVEFDLYQMVIGLLKEKNYLKKCFDFEQKKGLDYTIKAIINMLRLTGKNNRLVEAIVRQTPENCVVFLTGVGKCYPIVRSHNVLNTLHQVLDRVPVVLFFPGRYSGQDLQLFGNIKDDNYYRAFKLIE